MNQQKFGVRLWLWIVLATVIVLGGGVIYWYVLDSKGTTTTKTSPSPTKSVVSSPTKGATTTPASGITSTPASGTTSTPASTSTPTQTPPAGWKEITGTAIGAGSANVTFSVYIKNDWAERNENDTAHGPVFYTSNTNCPGAYGPGTGYQNCWDHLAVSYSSLSSYASASNLTIRTFPYPDASGNVYVGINKSLSASDQQTIFDSFKVLSHRTTL